MDPASESHSDPEPGSPAEPAAGAEAPGPGSATSAVKAQPTIARRGRRRLWFAAAAALVVVAALVTVLVIRLVGGGGLDTSGITRAQITVFQAIPPPDTIQVTLESSPAISAFDQLVQADGIGVGSSSNDLVPGCAGGVMTTIVLTRAQGAPTTLQLYSCGGTVGSNLTGDVTAFLSAVSSQYVDCRGWGSQSLGSCPGA